ncbi:histidine kinase [Bordetella trematum]|uniref:Sensor protein n=1 Tax=Bordetella trematum TaxID=123899 RepID=A0A157RHE1_9BORD|nr:type IV pili methyl-accepting chemotaxis transducer N-terminal domain-containing protein [Bordetella trematum]AZR92411.1 histidine kinase [Bordetella trematum]NNH21153.1 HAMP domain-containing protein [Bordetella trematum]QIM70980.1 HAMP domain-containing protein [Bordetella trematum]SAI57427.1 nitrate/nitrite sensor protein [Bordetella trematum]SAI60507.1 nitrate/nitrite sensor protein [Bordetella trematum]
MSALPPLRQRLSIRIVASSTGALLVISLIVGWTLLLSWQLQGAGAAINDTGSLRMGAYRVAVELLRAGPARAPRSQARMQEIDATLERLARGNPERPLSLPHDHTIDLQWRGVAGYWADTLKPAARRAIDGGDATPYLQALPEFVARADALVRMIEHDSARKTRLLRMSQIVLAVIAALGTPFMIWLLYLWIITPLLRLRQGLQRMAAHDFSVRLPVVRKDEFGLLAEGFNRMADELQALYTQLEQRVSQKTARLAARNRDIGTLYAVTAFLNQPADARALCEGFLRRLMRRFDAAGGSVRRFDDTSRQLKLLASVGLPESLISTPRCLSAQHCACDRALRRDALITFRRKSRPGEPPSPPCKEAGFTSVAMIRVAGLGSYALHFRQPRRLNASQIQVLRTLGHHLGVALENRRLSAQARQLAVIQERNLVAQGLHDSLAQGLNFLNLQLQLLQAGLDAGDLQEARQILPLLRNGVDESYRDVRELLHNFRSRLPQGDLRLAIEDTVARFQSQAGVQACLRFGQDWGAPLAPEQQLQVLFILQEALSNVRKHAQARHVYIQVDNGRDFVLDVRDDGLGYDPAVIATASGHHIGLHILRERAARLHGRIVLDARPGGGARVTLTLPGRQRHGA